LARAVLDDIRDKVAWLARGAEKHGRASQSPDQWPRGGVALNAQFNPRSCRSTRQVSWTNAKGPARGSRAGVQGAAVENLSATLYFDTYETKADVYGKYVSQLEKLVTIVGGLGRPPLVTFTWGKFTFKGVVESLSQSTPCSCLTGRGAAARSASR